MSMIGGIPSGSIISSNPGIGSVSNLSNAANTNFNTSYLNKADGMTSTVASGGIPAIRPNLLNRIGTSTVSAARGAVTSTVSATREVGNVLVNDVLPKPEPLSAKLMRNKLLGAIVVGGFVNGINTAVKVVQGEYTREQGVKVIAQDTAMGAISGLAFAGTMGITASTLGRVMGGAPLSIAALALGTLASIGITSMAREYIPFFKSRP